MEKETERGEGGKEKGERFVALMRGYHRRAWLVDWCWLGTGIRNAFRMFATFPKTSFRAIPRQQSRTNWKEEGIEAEEKQEQRNLLEKWMELVKVVQGG